MLLQAALNGPFGKDDHPAMPVSARELARDAAACVAAGAGQALEEPDVLWRASSARRRR